MGLLKIGEFSQLGQVTVRTLRHYDDLGLLKPTHIDPDSDYRYYAIDQLPQLHRILALKDLGLTLDQIGELVAHGVTADQLRQLLETSQAEIARQINEEQQRLARVAARLRLIEAEGGVSPFEVALKTLPALTVATIRRHVPHISDMKAYRCDEYAQIYAWLKGERIAPSGSELAIYHNEEFTETDIDMEVGVIVPSSMLDRAPPDPIVVQSLPSAPSMASVTHRGDMWEVTNAIVALYRWAFVNQRLIDGPYRELHLHWSEIAHDINFGNVVVEIQLPTRVAGG